MSIMALDVATRRGVDSTLEAGAKPGGLIQRYTLIHNFWKIWLSPKLLITSQILARLCQ